MSCPYKLKKGLCYCLAAYSDRTGNIRPDPQHDGHFCIKNDAYNSVHCPYFTQTALHSPSEFTDSKCYVTSAVCFHNQKPDDCYELTMFRDFRDNWLMKEPDGKALIDEYYENAPRIVNKIDASKDVDSIYQMIKNTFLAPCLRYIEDKNYSKCKEKYVEMMHELYKLEPTL